MISVQENWTASLLLLWSCLFPVNGIHWSIFFFISPLCFLCLEFLLIPYHIHIFHWFMLQCHVMDQRMHRFLLGMLSFVSLYICWLCLNHLQKVSIPPLVRYIIISVSSLLWQPFTSCESMEWDARIRSFAWLSPFRHYAGIIILPN